jgi:hypothetical protein
LVSQVFQGVPVFFLYQFLGSSKQFFAVVVTVVLELESLGYAAKPRNSLVIRKYSTSRFLIKIDNLA